MPLDAPAADIAPGTVVVPNPKFRSKLQYGRRYVVLSSSRGMMIVFPLSGPPSQKPPFVTTKEVVVEQDQNPVFTGSQAEKLKRALLAIQMQDKKVWQGDTFVVKQEKVSKPRPRVRFGGLAFAGIPWRNSDRLTIPMPIILKLLQKGNVYAKLAYHYDEMYPSSESGNVIDSHKLAQKLKQLGFGTASYQPAKDDTPASIHIHVHSNLSYDLFEKGASVPAPVELPPLTAAARKKLRAASLVLAAVDAVMHAPADMKEEARTQCLKAMQVATKLVKASGPALQPNAVLKLAKELLKNDKLAIMVYNVLMVPRFRKITRGWDREMWTAALLNNANNYRGLVDDDVLDKVDHVSIVVKMDGQYNVVPPAGLAEHPEVAKLVKQKFKDVADAHDAAQALFKNATVDVSSDSGFGATASAGGMDSLVKEVRAQVQKLAALADQADAALQGDVVYNHLMSAVDFLNKALKSTWVEKKVSGAAKISASEAHHFFDGKDYFVDSAFMNKLSQFWPEGYKGLTHMGMGEFSINLADGTEIEFDRMRGKEFPGQTGRSHKVYDNKDGKAVKHMVELAEKHKSSELVSGSYNKDGKLVCDMEKNCSEPVTHIDNKGFVYCSKHAVRRKASVPTRAIKPAELKKLEKHEPISGSSEIFLACRNTKCHVHGSHAPRKFTQKDLDAAEGVINCEYCDQPMAEVDKSGKAVKASPRLVDTIESGDRVTIVDSRGQQQTGKATMKSTKFDGWVLNMGGRFGKPGLASDENVVKVQKAKKSSASVAVDDQARRNAVVKPKKVSAAIERIDFDPPLGNFKVVYPDPYNQTYDSYILHRNPAKVNKVAVEALKSLEKAWNPGMFPNASAIMKFVDTWVTKALGKEVHVHWTSKSYPD
jgi:hypothetical protein